MGNYVEAKGKQQLKMAQTIHCSYDAIFKIVVIKEAQKPNKFNAAWKF
jgi:hypothetical protein